MLCPVLEVAQSIFILSLAQPGIKQVSAESGRKRRGCSALPVLFFLSPLGCIQQSLAKASLHSVGFGKVTLLNFTFSS